MVKKTVYNLLSKWVTQSYSGIHQALLETLFLLLPIRQIIHFSIQVFEKRNAFDKDTKFTSNGVFKTKMHLIDIK